MSRNCRHISESVQPKPSQARLPTTSRGGTAMPPKVKIKARRARACQNRCSDPVLTKVDADLAPSAEQ